MWVCLLIISFIALLVDAQSVLTYQTTIIDSPVDTIFWCGASLVVTQDDDTVYQEEHEKEQHKKVVFVLSNRGVLYRSIDYGFKWENVTQTFQTQYSQGSDYKIKELDQSPANSNIIFIIGLRSQSYKTFDCGRTYTPFNHPKKMYGFRYNKMDKNLIMAFQEKQCNKTEDSLCKDQYKREIWITKDGGNNWTIVLSRVRDANWDKLLHYEIIPDSRIIATHLSDQGKQLVSMSDDYFKTFKIIDSDAFGFYQSQKYLFVLVRPDVFSSGYDLKVAEGYQANEIVLPVDDQRKHTFTVLDTSDDQIFLSVAHSEQLPKLTNVYTSSHQQEYILSLLNNVRSQDNGNCDFEHVKGIEGVFIANVFDNSEVSKITKRRTQVTNEKDKQKYLEQFKRLDHYIKSVISFDKGAEWHQINAPNQTYNRQPLNCNGECSLHLRGRTQPISNTIYSQPSSVGIIIATGNTGIYLSKNDNETNTYLSRDGGHQWFEILRGSHIYEIGDHGGLIVFAENDRPTNRILYTWDEGLTFDDLVFARNFSIEIDNIVTEPSNMEQKFLVYGRQELFKLGINRTDPDIFSRYDSLKGILVAVDFTSVHQRVCTGQWDPTMPESDYEFWMPKNFHGDKCLFGKKLKYLRRKRNAKCFNPEDVEREQFIEKCECTEEDWECDFGYYRKIEGGKCIPQISQFVRNNPIQN